MSESTYKRCSCGHEYTQAQWSGLPFKGLLHFDADAYDPEVTLDCRTCTACRTMLAVNLDDTNRRPS
jgi:hypothetical protein